MNSKRSSAYVSFDVENGKGLPSQGQIEESNKSIMGNEYGLKPHGSELAVPNTDNKKVEKPAPLLGIRLNKLREGNDFQVRPEKYDVKKGVFKYGGPGSRSNGAENR